MFLSLRDEFQSTFENEFQIFLFENDLKAIIPETFLVVSSLFLLIYGVILSASKDNKYPILIENVSRLAQISLFFTMLLFSNSALTKGIVLYNSLVLDDWAFFLKIMLLGGAFFSILISIDYVQQEGLNSFELIILIMLSTASMLFLISAADFISMYLAIELQSLCFYVMAALKRNSEFSTEAGLKYFLLGAFSSGILLFGCSLIYGFTGVTNFSEIAKIFTCGAEELIFGGWSLRGCELGMVFILVGFLFKITAVPFHMWAPDVYEGAPTAVTAFFSITPKIAVLAVFVRLFFESFYDFMSPWQKIVIFCSIASMIWGSLAAMSQNKIKRLLAFSSIGHVGYLLVGFCCGTVEGIQALLIYLSIYVIMTINLFAIVLSPLRRETGGFAQEGETQVQRIKYTTDLAMLSKTNPILAITLTVTMFSIAGIPPLAGFYSKAFLMFAAMSASQYLLAIVAVLTSVISCFYYIRIVKIMYFESPLNWLTFLQLSKETSVALGLTFCFLVCFFLYPAPLFLATHKVALSLCF
jgi:proton-translocating NADH-quinone oxidoreductase chain N